MLRRVFPLCVLALVGLLGRSLLSRAAPVPKAKGRVGNPVVVFKTTKGTIKVELFEKEAPITVSNFLKYVNDRHYDGTIFHRVISSFMIQGGGYEKGMNNARNQNDVKDREKKTRDPIKNESANGLSNKR